MLVFSASFLEQRRMGPLQNLAIVLACWLMGEVASLDPQGYVWGFSGTPAPMMQLYLPSGVETYPYAWVDASQARALSLLSPVLAQCEEAHVMVTVKTDLFGTGRHVQVKDLSLGPTGCQPTSYIAAENTVIFYAGLHECGSVLKMTPDFLVYSISLHYKPTPSPHSIIVRTSPVDVPIECHYPRIRNDILQFTVDVFRFSKDPRDLIYITCHLKVAAATQVPDAENKACSFHPARNR
ncbi:hypothetical protein E2320_013314 [Naja naja]|nr:hypothetical protein E2320_013314 [Naja naja]